MLKPARLKRGDKVALLSPSSSAGAFFPRRIDRAAGVLRDIGYDPVVMPTSQAHDHGSAGTAAARVKDLHTAFADPEIRGIFCNIGGESANELLTELDYDMIAANPKIFCGYSDVTLLHFAIARRTGLVTFYGPMAMTQLGEFPAPHEFTMDHLHRAIADSRPIGQIRPSPYWTDELLPWDGADEVRPRHLKPAPPWRWLREGRATGPVIAGCVPSVCQLRGTPFDVNYDGAILFLEIPEGENLERGLSAETVAARLTDLKNGGVFDKIAGLVLGRPYCYEEKELAAFEELVARRVAPYRFPVLLNFDFGHTDPIVTLPIGVQATIDGRANTVSIDEPGVV